MIKIATNLIKKIFVENNSITKAFVGEHLVFNGKAERLPNEYTEVEYIEIGGASYIISKIAVTTLTTKVLLDITPTDSTSVARIICGSAAQLGSASVATISLRRETAKNLLCWAGTEVWNGSSFVDSGKTTIAYSLLKNSRVVICIDPLNKKMCVGNSTFTLSPISSNYAAGAFYFGTHLTNYASLYFKIHSAQIFVDGDLKGDFVPCVNSTGVAGLYNLINDSFSSASSGTVTPGPPV